jgi:hypothetical protein
MEISHIRTRKEKSIRERKERKKGKKRKENLYHDRTRGKSLSHPNTSFPTADERSICSSTRNITKETLKRKQKNENNNKKHTELNK